MSGDGAPRPDSMKLGLAEISVLVLCEPGDDLTPVHDALTDAGLLVIHAPDAKTIDLLPTPARYAIVELSLPGALDLQRRADTMAIAVVGRDEHEHAALSAGAIATLRRPLHADDVLVHLRRFRAHQERHLLDHEAVEREHANAGVHLLERSLASVASDLLPRLRASGRLLEAARHAESAADGTPRQLIDEALRSLDEVSERLRSLADLGGRAAPWVERVSLLEIARAAVAATPNHAGVSVEVDGRPDVAGWGDRTGLERVVADLVSHAFEAVRSAPAPRVHVRVYGTLTEARISIRHEDPRLRVSDCEALFVPALLPPRTTDELALIRARHAIAHMGGALTAAAEPNSRVVFRVRLRTGHAFIGGAETGSPTSRRRPAASRSTKGHSRSSSWRTMPIRSARSPMPSSKTDTRSAAPTTAGMLSQRWRSAGRPPCSST